MRRVQSEFTNASVCSNSHGVLFICCLELPCRRTGNAQIARDRCTQAGEGAGRGSCLVAQVQEQGQGLGRGPSREQACGLRAALELLLPAKHASFPDPSSLLEMLTTPEQFLRTPSGRCGPAPIHLIRVSLSGRWTPGSWTRTDGGNRLHKRGKQARGGRPHVHPGWSALTQTWVSRLLCGTLRRWGALNAPELAAFSSSVREQEGRERWPVGPCLSQGFPGRCSPVGGGSTTKNTGLPAFALVITQDPVLRADVPEGP